MEMSRMSKEIKFFISNQILNNFGKGFLNMIMKKINYFLIIMIQRWEKIDVRKSTDLMVSRTDFSGKRESKGWKGWILEKMSYRIIKKNYFFFSICSKNHWRKLWGCIFSIFACKLFILLGLYGGRWTRPLVI